jgi:hypothetical protein
MGDVRVDLAAAKELSRAGCCARCGSQLGSDSRNICSKCGCPVKAKSEDRVRQSSSSPAQLKSSSRWLDDRPYSESHEGNCSEKMRNGTSACELAEDDSPRDLLSKISALQKSDESAQIQTDPSLDTVARDTSPSHQHAAVSSWQTSSTARDRIRALVRQPGPFAKRNSCSLCKTLPPTPPRRHALHVSSEDDEDELHEIEAASTVGPKARRKQSHTSSDPRRRNRAQGNSRADLRGRKPGGDAGSFGVHSIGGKHTAPPPPPRPPHLAARLAMTGEISPSSQTPSRAVRIAEELDAISTANAEGMVVSQGGDQREDKRLLGCRWVEVDEEEATTGSLISNSLLAQALQSKVLFTLEELDELQVSGLSEDSYIIVGERYLKPVGEEQGPLTCWEFFLTPKGLLTTYAVMVFIVTFAIAVTYFASK